ncbi:Os06g0726000 [Oryza sativa Japonica Group]|uniref:Uncharacterized protein n=2 Tax=Oryza sativa subsp. japonica TaxID=39947 RepID=Q5Z973_ORYSJ|nr:hypothetical protein [Oryza sativa Japonica Group]BAD61799.1 hypothetical protein [Oryza sativa Japonica Group]BAS99594.1 Os06g0726000 [Oryza sativa Japonica Group]
MEVASATSKPPKNDDFDLNDLSLEAIQAAQEEEEAKYLKNLDISRYLLRTAVGASALLSCCNNGTFVEAHNRAYAQRKLAALDRGSSVASRLSGLSEKTN